MTIEYGEFIKIARVLDNDPKVRVVLVDAAAAAAVGGVVGGGVGALWKGTKGSFYGGLFGAIVGAVAVAAAHAQTIEEIFQTISVEDQDEIMRSIDQVAKKFDIFDGITLANNLASPFTPYKVSITIGIVNYLGKLLIRHGYKVMYLEDQQLNKVTSELCKFN